MFHLAKPAAPAAIFTRTVSSLRAAGAFSPGFRAGRTWWTAFKLVAIFGSALPGTDAHASELLNPELRVASAYRGKFDVDIYTMAWYVRAPRWTRADRLELSAGVIRDADDSQPFTFLGPVWRLTSPKQASFLEFSIGPTVAGGSTFDGRDLGGNVHFRSAVAFGRSAGRKRSFEIALRIEHVSNGGLRNSNPGLDSIGLGIVLSSADRVGK